MADNSQFEASAITIESRLEETGYTSSLAKHEIKRLARSGKISHSRKERPVFYQDDPSAYAYLILDGSVKRTKYRSDDTTLSLGIAGGGEWIGLVEVVLNCPYLHDAVATEPLELLSFSRGQIIGFLSQPGIAKYLILGIARDSYLLHSRIELNLPGARIAAFLLDDTRDDNSSIVKTQDEIAAAVGLARETVNRYLKRFEAEGAIELSRGQLLVVDRDALQAVIKNL